MKKNSREILSIRKIFSIINTFFDSNLRQADVYLSKFSDLNLFSISKKTGKKITSLILDVDGSIAPDGGKILPENIKKIHSLLKDGIKIGIYSNASKDLRLKSLVKKGVKIYTGSIPKPQKKGFIDACKSFSFNPKTTWMVGENPLTDGGAIGVLGGMIFVEPIPDNLHNATATKKVTRHIYSILRSLAIKRMLLFNKKILRNKDFK